MKNLVLSLAAAIALTSTASAALLNTTVQTGLQLENILLAKEANVAIENQNIPVSIIGAGLRSKKVAIINVKVYVAELFSSDASKFVRTEAEALNSLEQSRTVGYRLNFVRTVDAPTVQASFAEALKVNGVDISETAIAQFLSAVANGGDATSGKSLSWVTHKNADKTEAVYYEDSNGKVTKVVGGEGLSRKINSIVLGKGADAGVDSLRAQILKGL